MQNVMIGVLALLTANACIAPESGRPLAQASAAAAGYNVLLVTLDTTRADRLGCYGYSAAVTPTLDRLAATGVRVADAVTVAPVTLPAHASILTGRYPATHGVRDNGEFVLHTDQTTLAERLAAGGYETAAFVSAFVLDARFGLDQGFALYDDAVQPETRAGGLIEHANERNAEQVTDAAIAWLRERTVERPFFAWVHYFDPHQPYASNSDPRFADRPYDAEIALVDRELGRLLADLASSGQHERTLVVVVADHGEGLGEHDEATHALLIYDSTMRVPLILNAPGALAAGQVAAGATVSVVDIVPTVLDLLGLDAASEMEGVALSGVGPDPDRLAYMESLVPWLDHGWSPLYAVRRHGDKLIRSPEPEYFDLTADAAEAHNLYLDAGARSASRDRLDEELTAWLSVSPLAADVSATAAQLDPEAQARLESLGYTAGVEVATGASLADPKRMLPFVRKLDEGKALAAAGRFDAALEAIEGLADELGESRTLLGQLARIYARVGREDEAAAVLERYLTIRPSTQALVMLAQIRISQGNVEEATRHLDAAFALDPRHGAIHIARGDIALFGGDLTTARAHYLEAGNVDPYRARAAMQSRLGMLRARGARGQ